MKNHEKNLEKELYKTTAKLKQYQQQRLKNFIDSFKEVERRKRNYRLITRGTDAESVAPGIRDMGQSVLRLLVEQSFSLQEVVALVCRFTDQKGDF